MTLYDPASELAAEVRRRRRIAFAVAAGACILLPALVWLGYYLHARYGIVGPGLIVGIVLTGWTARRALNRRRGG
jgi:asparagine N-glycosylation enzyme membrane subunit Stt3